MKSEFKLNIVPIAVTRQEVDVCFSLVHKPSYARVHIDNIPKELQLNVMNNDAEFVWWTLEGEEDDQRATINLEVNYKFAKHYFNKIVFDYFANSGFITDRNFIGDTEIYIEDSNAEKREYKKLNKFALKVLDSNLIKGLGILVSYEKSPSLLNKNLTQVNLDPEWIGKVLYKSRVVRYSELNDEERNQPEEIVPFLNRKIILGLKLPYEREVVRNKYKKYFDLVSNFYQKYLQELEIGNTIRILGSGFQRFPVDRINHTSSDSNLLLFGNNNKNYVPYMGMKQYGPIQGPSSSIRFFFIFHHDDRELANKLYSYIKKGYRGFPGLSSFAKIDFEIDNGKTIRFVADNPIPEIEESLNKFEFNPDTTYAAIYISRVKRDADDAEEDRYYYQLKERLLSRNITSQVIFRENITNPSFNYFLPNIAIALLAKLGGIPWRLYRPVKNDLVIGIGADRSLGAKTQFIGSAFCFLNDGTFKEFDVFEKGDTKSLARSILNAIQAYTEQNRGFDRLVIHYYKKLNFREEEPIREVLNNLPSSIPYFVLTINETESKDFVVFDTDFEGKMPKSGTFFALRKNTFLLCNNTRYSDLTATKIDGYPFPIKITIQSSGYSSIDYSIARELLDQVYQFSRMYWKSVRQGNMPVTIEYSKILAKIISHFENKKLVPFARKTLWFL